MKRSLSLLFAVLITILCCTQSVVLAEDEIVSTTPTTTVSTTTQAPTTQAPKTFEVEVRSVDKMFLITITDKDSGCNFYTINVNGESDGCIMEGINGVHTYFSWEYELGKTYEIEIVGTGGEKPITVKKTIYHTIPTPEVTTVQQKNGYKLKFSSSSANGYEIYRYNSKNKALTLYKKTTKKSLTIKSNSADSYKVRAYATINGKKIYSEYSKEIIGIKSASGKVDANSATSDKDGRLTVKWAKNNKYDGWIIQYSSYDDFSHYNTYTVAGKGKTSATIPVIGGITYKVRVRGYKVVKGVKSLTKWGNSKTVVVKSSVSSNPNATKLLNSIKLKPLKTDCKKLDKIVAKIIKKYTNDKMTTAQKVRQMYLYVSNERFSSYGIKGERNYSSMMELNALTLLETKSGSCVHYNSLFTVLCNRIGIRNAYLANGSVPRAGGGRTAHTWCMIKINKHNYIFDPRMQKYTPDRNGYKYYCVPLSEKSKTAQEFRFFNAKEQIK